MVQTAKVTRVLADGRAEGAVKRQSACGDDWSKCGGGCSELRVSSPVAVIAANPVRAMPGDMVLVEKFEHPRVEGSDEGEILAILEEKNDLVGTARRIEGRLKFVPDDCPAISMQMMRDCEGGAKDGDKV